MKTILCVSHVVPWPGAHGNEIRLQRLLVWLRKQGYRIILVITAADVKAESIALVRSHVDRLELPCQTTRSLDTGRLLDRSLHVMRELRSWLTSGNAPPVRGPMHTLAEAVCPDRVGRLVRRLARQEEVHVYVAYYALALRAFHWVSCRDFVLCDTVEAFSMVHHDAAGKPTDRVLSFAPGEERAMLLASGHIMAIQRAEAGYLARLVPERPLLTVGMDCDVPSHPGRPSEAAEVIGVVGSANQANVDGLRVFLDQSWPLIRARVPSARLRIAGGLGAATRHMHGSTASAGVEMTGWIADIADFYRGVRLVVNPVRIGTGLKIKTVEALAHCRPVVTHAIGCEGIEPGAEEAMCVVDEASAMAEACATLLLDPDRCDRMALAAGTFAAATLSADIVYAPLRGLLETIGAGRG